MKIRPLNDHILVKPTEEQEGGIVVPEGAREKPLEGKVVAVSRDPQQALQLKTGDRVLFPKYAGIEVPVDDGEEERLAVRGDRIIGTPSGSTANRRHAVEIVVSSKSITPEREMTFLRALTEQINDAGGALYRIRRPPQSFLILREGDVLGVIE